MKKALKRIRRQVRQTVDFEAPAGRSARESSLGTLRTWLTALGDQLEGVRAITVVATAALREQCADVDVDVATCLQRGVSGPVADIISKIKMCHALIDQRNSVKSVIRTISKTSKGN